MKNILKLYIFICFFSTVNVVKSQEYYIETKNKREKFSYYFNVMDSMISQNPSDSFYNCINCVRFMQSETKIQASGNITYFGKMEFTKEDLEKWLIWFEKKYLRGKRK